ncbi:MAG: hypothetical protein A2X99_02285 [Deltaproteobacteria bacterium GWB2_55_19]|nr:MAG: hypothetical protein A2X99_02285 [Deltaproteobacteria bacterium GWB2_55_19]
MFTEYKLSRALMIYDGNGEYGRHYYIQEHDVMDVAGKPVLLAGTPLSVDRLISLCRTVAPDLMDGRGFRYHDDRLLASGVLQADPAVWWAPPAKRPMFFTRHLNIQSVNVSWPGLIFVASARGLDVYAVKGDKRPSLKTRLYKAPFMNVNVNGNVCLGNAPTPQSNLDMEAWERAFFGSEFSEIHDTARAKTDLATLWSGINKKRGRGAFPEDVLLPQQKPLQTLGDLIGSIAQRTVS